MKKASPIAIHTACFALTVAAFFVGTSFRKGDPTRGKADPSASSAADAPKGSVVELSTNIGMERNPATKDGRRATTRTTNASQMAGEKVGQVIGELMATVAAQRTQKEIYRDELLALVKSLTVENAGGIAIAFKENYRNFMYSNEIGPAYDEFYRAWGALAGADAMAFDEKLDNTASGKIIAGWAKSDPDAAKAYAMKVNAGTIRGREIHSALVISLADTDIEDAIAHSVRYESKSQSGCDSALKFSEKLFTEQGVKGIESWFARMDEALAPGEAADYRDDVVQSGLANMAKEDPARAREWLLDFADRGFMSVETLKDAADRVTPDDTMVDELSLIAMVRAPTVKEQGGYSQLLTDTFENYLRCDIDGAGTWLAGQPRDARYDGSIQKYALQAARIDQDAARLWAQEIRDERLREATLARPEFTRNPSVIRPRKN
jgi:hypothetical protein